MADRRTTAKNINKKTINKNMQTAPVGKMARKRKNANNGIIVYKQLNFDNKNEKFRGIIREK